MRDSVVQTCLKALSIIIPFKQRLSPVILWEISDVTITAAFLSAGSVMAITTVVMAQMRGTAVSISLHSATLFY